jgi:hypothetical protein
LETPLRAWVFLHSLSQERTFEQYGDGALAPSLRTRSRSNVIRVKNVDAFLLEDSRCYPGHTGHR